MSPIKPTLIASCISIILLCSAMCCHGADNWFALLAAPENYDGTKIRLTGWLHIELNAQGEDYTLFFSSEDLRECLYDRSVALEPKTMNIFLEKTFPARESYTQYQNKLITVSGTFVSPFTKDGNPRVFIHQGLIKDIDDLKVKGEIQVIYRYEDAPDKKQKEKEVKKIEEHKNNAPVFSSGCKEQLILKLDGATTKKISDSCDCQVIFKTMKIWGR